MFPCSDEEQTYTIVDGIEALSHRAALDELRSETDAETETTEQRPLIKSL